MDLLDTNTLSDLRRAQRGQTSAIFRAWAFKASSRGRFISVVVSLLEIRRGILLLERRDKIQAERLDQWLGVVLNEFSKRVLDVTPEVAEAAAALHIPDPRPELDTLIAAAALVHGLTLVTRNTADFTGTGVPLFNPWQA